MLKFVRWPYALILLYTAAYACSVPPSQTQGPSSQKKSEFQSNCRSGDSKCLAMAKRSRADSSPTGAEHEGSASDQEDGSSSAASHPEQGAQGSQSAPSNRSSQSGANDEGGKPPPQLTSYQPSGDPKQLSWVLREWMDGPNKTFKAYGMMKYLLNSEYVYLAPKQNNFTLNNPGFECPSGSVLVGVQSLYDMTLRDRIYQARCAFLEDGMRRLVTKGECTDHSVNHDKGDMDFQCPAGKLLTGHSNVFSAGTRDRLHKLRCCKFTTEDGNAIDFYSEDEQDGEKPETMCEQRVPARRAKTLYNNLMLANRDVNPDRQTINFVCQPGMVLRSVESEYMTRQDSSLGTLSWDTIKNHMIEIGLISSARSNDLSWEEHASRASQQFHQSEADQINNAGAADRIFSFRCCPVKVK